MLTTCWLVVGTVFWDPETIDEEIVVRVLGLQVGLEGTAVFEETELVVNVLTEELAGIDEVVK